MVEWGLYKNEKMINGCGKYEILKCGFNEVKLVWL
jgi:hypothetical protein